MKKCKHCNSYIANESLMFCENCGNKLEEVTSNNSFCSNCGAVLDDESLFCINCGEKVENIQNTTVEAKTCPKCGFNVEMDATYCENCGYNFNSEENEEVIEFVDDSIIYVKNTEEEVIESKNESVILIEEPQVEEQSTTINEELGQTQFRANEEKEEKLEITEDDKLIDSVMYNENNKKENIIDNTESKIENDEQIVIENIESSQIDFDNTKEEPKDYETSKYQVSTQMDIIEENSNNNDQNTENNVFWDQSKSSEVSENINISTEILGQGENDKPILDTKSEIIEPVINEIKKVNCPYCQNLIDENSVFCPNCGLNLSVDSKSVYTMTNESSSYQKQAVNISPNIAPSINVIMPTLNYQYDGSTDYYCDDCGHGQNKNTIWCEQCKGKLVRANKLAFSYAEDDVSKRDKKQKEKKLAKHQEALEKYRQGKKNSVLAICWYIFGAIFAGLFSGVGILIYFLTIAGFFFGFDKLQIFKYVFNPQNIHIVKNTKKYWYLNVLWFIMGGFIVLLLFRIVQCLFIMSIFGIPISKELNKFVQFFKSPFSAKILTNDEFSNEELEHAVYARQFMLRNKKLNIFQPNFIEIKKAEKKEQRRKNAIFVLFFFMFIIAFSTIYLWYILKLPFVDIIFENKYFEIFRENSSYVFYGIIAFFFVLAFYCTIYKQTEKKYVVNGYGTRNQLTMKFDKVKYYPRNNNVMKLYYKVYVDYKPEIDDFLENEK